MTIEKVTLRGVSHDQVTGTTSVVIGWEATKIGSGELTLNYHHEIKAWTADTERMSREFCTSVLLKVAQAYSVADPLEDYLPPTTA